MATHEDDLWDMSDEDAEAAFKEAKAQANSPETGVENDAEAAEAAEALAAEEAAAAAADEDNDEEGDATVDPDLDVENTDGKEQPDANATDSDHDASAELDADKADADKSTDTDAENPDGDTKAVDAESEKAEPEKGEEQPPRNYSFKANGKDYNFSSEEIVDQFPKIFGKAMDYTKKMQAIKPWRKSIDALEEAKLTHEDVSLMIDVLKGDKTAINAMLKRTGVETLDLNAEEDGEYVAKDYGRDADALAIDDVIQTISQDVEYKQTQNILSKEWDQKSWETMSKDPEKIRLLHDDVKTGMFDTLSPIAEKLKLYDNGSKSDLEYYGQAAQQHFKATADQKAIQDQKVAKQAEAEASTAAAAKIVADNAAKIAKAKTDAAKRKTDAAASEKRKAAAPAKTGASDVKGLLGDSDEDFDEWYKKLQENM